MKKTYKVNVGSGTYKIEADDMKVCGDFVELLLNGKSVAIFFRPVAVILLDD